MRAIGLTALFAAALFAQQKDLTFQQIGSGTLSGYTEDEKAEKAWEMKAVQMLPSEIPGQWVMNQLQGQSFQGGKAVVTFNSPSGLVDPTKRTAEGDTEFKAKSTSFNLRGDGWNWKSTPVGDTFTVLANVTAELDLAKAIAQRMHVTAQRLEVVPSAEGTTLVFKGGVVVNRTNEKITCEEVQCVLNDEVGGDKSWRQIRAKGRVVRVFNNQTLSGDAAIFTQKTDTVELTGNVLLEDPELTATAKNLVYNSETQVIQMHAGEMGLVNIKTRRAGRSPAEFTGLSGRIERDIKTGLQSLTMEGEANFQSEQGKVAAKKINVSEVKEGGSKVVADGAVKGSVKETNFYAEHSQWQQLKALLELEGQSRLIDRRGLELAGAKIRSDMSQEKVTVSSGSGQRASIKLKSEGDVEARAEAEQIYISNNGQSAEVDLLGKVHYTMGEVSSDSDRLVAYSLPRTANTPRNVFVLQKIFLTGNASLNQPNLKCLAERIDYQPAVEVEEVLKTDNLKGKPQLITMSGGTGETRPRLKLQDEKGKPSLFISDAQEILITPEITKFFLRGSVGMKNDNADATCELLEGLAKADDTGRQSPDLIVGRGNVKIVADGTSAVGRTMEINPRTGEARLFGDARIRDNKGNEGVPAKEVVYDYANRRWRMEQSVDEANPKQVIRPKIILGPEFSLPAVKNLDNSR
jgi:lipopolysaccharide export system protein LptA